MRHKVLVRLRSRLPSSSSTSFILAGMAILISRLADNVTPDPTGLPRQPRFGPLVPPEPTPLRPREPRNLNGLKAGCSGWTCKVFPIAVKTFAHSRASQGGRWEQGGRLYPD